MGGDVFRAGVVSVFGAGLPPRCGPSSPPPRAVASIAVGQGVSGSASPPRRGADAGAVRGAGRAGGTRRRRPACGSAASAPSAFDGCVSFKVPDTARNGSWLGKLKAALGATGYPVIELMAAGRDRHPGAAGRGASAHPPPGEIEYARKLLALLSSEMLVLTRPRLRRRAVPGTSVAGTGARFLARLRVTRRLPVLARLDDGSHLSRIGELAVRIITADITVTCADGTRYIANYRLATTLTDHAPPSRPPTRRPLPRTLGTRDRLPGTAPHPHRRPRAALDRPSRTRTGTVGAAHRLPGTAPRHRHRGRIPPRHRPGPGQLHHRPRSRQGSAGQRRQHHATDPTDLVGRIGHAVLDQPAPTPTPPHQRAQGQIPAVALQQERPTTGPKHSTPTHQPRPSPSTTRATETCDTRNRNR